MFRLLHIKTSHVALKLWWGTHKPNIKRQKKKSADKCELGMKIERVDLCRRESYHNLPSFATGHPKKCITSINQNLRGKTQTNI